MTTFYLIRHGQTTGNIRGLVSGHWDVDLTEDGEIQAAIRAKSLKDIPFDVAFSSDLIRAKRTAEIIALEHKLAVQTTQLIRERRYGDLEGEKTEEEIRKIRELFHEYWQIEYDKKA